MAQEENTLQPAVFWKREITYGQFLGFIAAIITTAFTIIYDLKMQVSEAKLRITNLEKVQAEFPSSVKESMGEVKIEIKELRQLIMQSYELKFEKQNK